MTSRTLKFIGLAVVAAVASWIFWSRRPVSYANYPPHAGHTWVAFGDSLTAGTGARSGHDYPSQLGKILGIDVINLGMVGNTTADGLARIDAVLELDPRVVLLCLGGNDSLQQVPLSETMTNLATIIDRLQAHGAFVVVIGIHSATAFDQFSKPFRSLARQHHALHIPNLLEGVLAHPSLMSDTIHPNDAGYALIAERLAKVLDPFLPSLQPPAVAPANSRVTSGEEPG